MFKRILYRLLIGYFSIGFLVLLYSLIESSGSVLDFGLFWMMYFVTMWPVVLMMVYAFSNAG